MASSRVQYVLIKKCCSYDCMLTKCVEQLHGKRISAPSNTYYLADGSGIDIAGESTEYLTIDCGTCGRRIPWILETYMYLKVNGKSAAEARFYCVEVPGYFSMTLIGIRLIVLHLCIRKGKGNEKEVKNLTARCVQLCLQEKAATLFASVRMYTCHF